MTYVITEEKMGKLLGLLEEAREMHCSTLSSTDFCYYLGIERTLKTIIGIDKYIVLNPETKKYEIE